MDAWEESNDLFVEGNPSLIVEPGTVFDSRGDHRLAMTWALVGLCGNTAVEIKDFDCVSVSYPNFLDDIKKLARA